jgi:hypothetical protein
LRHHRFGEADEAAIVAVVDVYVAGLTSVNYAGDRLAVLVLYVDEDRRADRVKIPNVMRNILQMANVLAGIEIKRNERVSVKVVARTEPAVEIR